MELARKRNREKMVSLLGDASQQPRKPAGGMARLSRKEAEIAGRSPFSEDAFEDMTLEERFDALFDSDSRTAVMATLWDGLLNGRSPALITTKLRELGIDDGTIDHMLLAAADLRARDRDEIIGLRLANVTHPRAAVPQDGRYFEELVVVEHLLCSDDECPCSGDTELTPGKDFYLYISPRIVTQRRKYPDAHDFQRHLDETTRQIAAIVFHGPGTVNPIAICRTAAERRGLDLEVALADGLNWWNTGMCPLRVTPRARSWWQFWR